MERGPLLEILEGMKGTAKELDLTLPGENEPIEIRNVVEVESLSSTHGLKITTKQNLIWIDAGHIACAWQARDDI
ncbi:MAG: hypothetical protein HKO59_17180 [Phycisphaerales bacterium]|nr:hypothetical protein [Phycisphaerae bacterium]NNF44015.1 hypothetical protein [Phycisphaerales bacterium]NNM27684.1 hypothetical protein [Phycisphaerales bacterium]